MNSGWSTRKTLVYHNVNVNGCQATNYLCDVYVWFIIFCQTVLEFIILHKHNIFILVTTFFSFYYIPMYIICIETLFHNHGNRKEREKIYCLTKNPSHERMSWARISFTTYGVAQHIKRDFQRCTKIETWYLSITYTHIQTNIVAAIAYIKDSYFSILKTLKVEMVALCGPEYKLLNFLIASPRLSFFRVEKKKRNKKSWLLVMYIPMFVSYYNKSQSSIDWCRSYTSWIWRLMVLLITKETLTYYM